MLDHLQSDSQRGRSPHDERQPQDKDGKPKGGKPYQRDFSVPAPKAQDNFTGPDSRKTHTGSAASQVFADAGYRSEAVMGELATTQTDTELVITLWRKRKILAKPRDAKCYPHTAAMAEPSPTAGSRTFWGFASSACGARKRRKPSSSSSAWHPDS